MDRPFGSFNATKMEDAWTWSMYRRRFGLWLAVSVPVRLLTGFWLANERTECCVEGEGTSDLTVWYSLRDGWVTNN